MFDSSRSITARLTDAADLLIDFATLGEYGLEPVANPAPTCETRHRPVSPATTQTSPCRRPGAPTLALATEAPQALHRRPVSSSPIA